MGHGYTCNPFSIQAINCVEILRLLSMKKEGDQPGLMTSTSLAREMNISISHMEKLLHILNASGWLVAVKGPNGGYKLQVDIESITIFHVLQLCWKEQTLPLPDNALIRAAKCIAVNQF